MNRPEQKKLFASLKIIIPLWVTFGLIVISIFFIFVPSLEKNILFQKKEMIRNLTDNNWSLISEYNQMVKQGELTLEVAQSEAIRRIRGLRYGPESKDYFWINDMHPKMIMHPYFPNLEGKDMSGLTDPNGRHLIVEFVKIVQQKGAGYIDYMWQWKDDPKKIVPKISYVRGFEPWGWIIGTGIYIEDVHYEIKLITHDLIKIFSGLLILITGLSSYITWQAVKSEKKRSQAENDLRKREEEYRSIFENTGTATVIIEKDMIISLANAKFVDLSGYSREEIEGKKSWVEFVVPEDLKKMKAQHKARRANGDDALKTYEFQFIDRKKNIKHILLEADIIQGTNKSVSSLLDITERKLTEQALQTSHQSFLTILNSVDATIYVADMETYEIIFVNKQMIEHFGWDMTGEICWKAFRKLSGPCQHCTNGQLLDKHNKPKGVLTWQDKNPITGKWYQNFDRAIEWTDGRLVRLQIATDITHLKNMEKELRQAHKMESIGTLAGGIAHDFNNILFPIVGYTELLLEEISEESPLRNSLNEIYAGTMRARDLVKQILTFSRQDISELKLIKMQPIIEEALKLIRSSIPTTITIKQNIDTNCGIIKADTTQIHQIIMNIATNAYHAMEKTGGELKIDLKEIELSGYDAVYPDMTPLVYACLTITDTGIGMDKDITGKIFDPFFTTKKEGKGTGMGLSVVHGIVKNMKGIIRFKSEPSKGTEFCIYLPIVKKSSKETNMSIEKPIQKGDEHVLLVDDEEDIVTMEKQMLEHFGYQVTAHTSSVEALETFRAHPDKFDLVITDMAMPTMPGDVLAAKLVKTAPDIPILLCTGYSEIMSEKKAVSIGIKGFLMKPIVMKDLSDKIREVLDKKSN
jgi:PAS domain S-box-containing protein